MHHLSSKSVLVTGANSGLGYEAAAQLAEAGYGRVILACRTIDKASAARDSLVERVSRDPFELLAVDVSSIEAAERASAELIERGQPIDSLLLNAGMVSGPEMHKSPDGLEQAFAASIIGHHIIAKRLIEADIVTKGGRIVIAGSEAANNDLPAMMDMKLYDFAFGEPHEFGDNLHDAMINFARGAKPERFNPTRYYAATKLFVAWWSAAMTRRYGDRVSVFTVSPGSSLETNAGRHIKGFKRFLFLRVMPVVGPLLGMDQSIPVATKRYMDVLLERGDFRSGRTYTSRPRKLVGPLHEVDYPHILDEERQEVAWGVLDELTERSQVSASA